MTIRAQGKEVRKEEGFTFRNSKAKWQTIVAKKAKLKTTGEQPLFLGMHYVKVQGLVESLIKQARIRIVACQMMGAFRP
jgi:hypothetical protein